MRSIFVLLLALCVFSAFCVPGPVDAGSPLPDGFVGLTVDNPAPETVESVTFLASYASPEDYAAVYGVQDSPIAPTAPSAKAGCVNCGCAASQSYKARSAVVYETSPRTVSSGAACYTSPYASSAGSETYTYTNAAPMRVGLLGRIFGFRGERVGPLRRIFRGCR